MTFEEWGDYQKLIAQEAAFDMYSDWKADREQYRADLSACQERYNELLMAVGYKFPEESRHETALRYIRQAETVSAVGAQAHNQTKGVEG
jgi:hypothetical protein